MVEFKTEKRDKRLVTTAESQFAYGNRSSQFLVQQQTEVFQQQQQQNQSNTDINSGGESYQYNGGIGNNSFSSENGSEHGSSETRRLSTPIEIEQHDTTNRHVIKGIGSAHRARSQTLPYQSPQQLTATHLGDMNSARYTAAPYTTTTSSLYFDRRTNSNMPILPNLSPFSNHPKIVQLPPPIDASVTDNTSDGWRGDINETPQQQPAPPQQTTPVSYERANMHPNNITPGMHQATPDYGMMTPRFPNGNVTPPMAPNGSPVKQQSPQTPTRPPQAPAPAAMMTTFSSKTVSSTPKRYKCTICQKRFTRPSSLQTHMYSHTGEKPFKCPVEGCGRHFSVVSNLRRHQKIHAAPP
ncbi:3743_t:CDS:2 [Ambispora gerdemannii]|uniref:3743_t:CDS:1 n=1 Tax=Ambispora gerdemannii TaxID=144530 RepID=A0A9N8ZPY1_9GLOM|nr:3743_t:CDS:2 [Ambispora gerdemannii]